MADISGREGIEWVMTAALTPSFSDSIFIHLL